VPDRPVYRLTLTALPADTPAVVRLRLLLKHALRAWRLKCLSAEELPADGDDAPDANVAQRRAGPPGGAGERAEKLSQSLCPAGRPRGSVGPSPSRPA